MSKLDCWFITGLADAESSFIVSIVRDNTRSIGYNIQVSFELGLNSKDKDLLEKIRNKFGAGNIFHNINDNTYKYKVSKINEINNIIIPHFKRYYLITQKRIDFELFSRIVEIIRNKEHLTTQGLQKIVNLKATLNLGISDNLKKNFPETKDIERGIYNNINIPNSNWLSGFSEGESCFYISLYKSDKSKLKLAVQLVFKITQHYRDIELLKSISNYLGCGRVEKRKGDACDFTVTSFKSFEEKIIPFFLKNPLYGSKSLELEAFKKAFIIIKKKEHLKHEGLEELKKIKNSMNTKKK
jgi:hypothetical protein